MSKRIISILSIILILSMLLSACGGNNTGIESTPAGNTDPTVEIAVRDDLNFALVAEPKTLNPSLANNLVDYAVFHQIFNYLIDLKTDSTMVPGLAESWEYSEDGSEITFHLRKGVKFHNGDTMNAEDVAFSLNNAIGSAATKNVTSMMDSAEVIDENTVLLKLKYPFGAIEFCIAASQMGIVNKKAYEADPDGFGRNPVGTGPYKFVDWKGGDRIVLERFDDYYKGPAVIKDVTFIIMTDSSTAVLALEKGEVDIIDTPPRTEKQYLLTQPQLKYYDTEIAATAFIAFNHEDEYFSNAKVRQAVAHSINKETLIMGALEGDGTPLETPMAVNVFGWPEDFKFWEYDVEKAKALLAEAGYPDGFTITLKTTESPTYSKPTEVIQDQLKQIGITANIEKLERGAFWDSLLTKRDYGMGMAAWSVVYPDADHIYATFHSDMITTGLNYMNYNNKDLDALLDEGRTSTDPERRKVIYREICELFKENSVMVPLYTYMSPIAADKNLKGVLPSPTNRMFVYDYYWEN
ncbi:MAG: ABC transporter substrate-binding protein [Eubacteriales bacterium]|nr:ABC transporter substrate-binding protein [Eubacteriales bacterium]